MPLNVRLKTNADDATAAPVAVTGVTITDSSSGSASATIAAIGATYDQDEVRDAVASLAAELEANRVDIAAQKVELDKLITDVASIRSTLND